MRRALALSIVLSGLCLGCAGEPAGAAAPTESGARPGAAGPVGPIGEVNDLYLRMVKPIVAHKCLDCHGGPTHYPWYHAVPGVKQLIDRDVSEARRDVDMSRDFPFLGNATPLEFLGAMRDVVEDGSMPPRRYRALHPGFALSAQDKDGIVRWVERGEEILKAAPPPGH